MDRKLFGALSLFAVIFPLGFSIGQSWAIGGGPLGDSANAHVVQTALVCVPFYVIATLGAFGAVRHGYARAWKALGAALVAAVCLTFGGWGALWVHASHGGEGYGFALPVMLAGPLWVTAPSVAAWWVATVLDREIEGYRD